MTNRMKSGVFMAVLAAGVLSVEAFPLKVDIDVTTKRERKELGAGDSGSAKAESVVVKVKIRKSGGDVPEGKLQAELYVIGKQLHTGYYGIIDVRKGEIELTKENDYTFTYESPAYTLAQTSGKVKVGGVYETYLVVISDAEGNMIDWRSGRALRDKGVAFIRELGPKTLFDRDGNVIGELENPGEAFKAALPTALETDGPGGPRPEPY